jgi:hypothetical protein
MRAASKPYPSLDDQILACIEAAKISDDGAKLEDFQLRTVENDLILFNLKTSQSYALYDADNEPVEEYTEPLPLSAARPARTTVKIARSSAARAKRSADRLLGWIAAQHISIHPPAR